MKDVELFRDGSVHEFYRLKALNTLKQVNTSVAEKRKKKKGKKKVCNVVRILYYCFFSGFHSSETLKSDFVNL